MKQTQTKLFSYSDTGLDFSSGSKNLFPDRFKRILSQGYNTQTVASVSVTGDQVTFTYGGTHGYTADRVLKVSNGSFASVNGGEFWIDSITSNSVTITMDNIPTSYSGNFSTSIASLGWDLVYELGNVQVYKFKDLSENDLFARFCFQNNANYRNRVSVCVGYNFDSQTGFIQDINAMATTKACVSPVNFAWEFSMSTESAYNNYTYDQGLSAFGKTFIVGSAYHLISLNNTSSSNNSMRINAILPVHGYYSKLPLIIGEERTPSGSGVTAALDAASGWLGNIKIQLNPHSTGLTAPAYEPFLSNYYPADLDAFNTTSASPVFVYESTTGQILGLIQTGFYRIHYKAAGAPFTMSNKVAPIETYDIDLGNKILIHGLSNSSNQVSFFGVCVEEVKYGY